MATISSTSSCNFKASVFDGPQIRQPIKDSLTELCQTLRRMFGYHLKTSSRTFLEIHMQVVTQTLYRNYWRAIKRLFAT